MISRRRRGSARGEPSNGVPQRFRWSDGGKRGGARVMMVAVALMTRAVEWLRIVVSRSSRHWGDEKASHKAEKGYNRNLLLDAKPRLTRHIHSGVFGF